MDLNLVAPEDIPHVWPVVGPLLDEALTLAECKDYTVEHLEGFVRRGQHELIVVLDGESIKGALTVCYEVFPLRRVAVITAMSGRLISNPDTWRQLKTFLRFRGVSAVRGHARESVARLWRRYGLEEHCRIVEVSL